VKVFNGAHDNTVGGTTDKGNIISGNTTSGVLITGTTATNNTVAGNYIGTDASGMSALGNSDGVWIDTSSGNTVGGTSVGARNVISGNTGYGVLVTGPSASTTIEGNLIGTDSSGANDLGNAGVGVNIQNGSSLSTIRGNTIAGNDGGGVLVIGSTTHHNTLVGNFIGTDRSGASAVGNGKIGAGNARFGIQIDGANNIQIGGPIETDRNLISGNTGDGLVLQNGANSNNVQGNWFGVDKPGVQAISNTVHAIHLLGANTNNNNFGGLISSAGNLLAFSGGSALRLEDLTSTTASGNVFQAYNTLRGNLGLAIDVGAAGLTLNDGLDGASDLRDYPVLTKSI